MMVRAPIVTPAPITANAPTAAVGSSATPGATDASVLMPAAGRGAGGDRIPAARANVRYGDLLRITAHGAGSASPFMMMADALVVATFEAYFGLARTVRSP